MDFPFYIQIGSSKILLHAVLETAAFFIGFRYFLFLRRKQGDAIESSNRIWVIIGAIFGALIGSRLVGGLENIDALNTASNKTLYFYQNKTVVGGFLGGLFAVELIKKLIKERSASGDLFVFPMILALIIGRIGCFSMGVYEETYGLTTTLPWGLNLGDGLYRHPVCIYEIIYLLTSYLWIRWLEKRFELANGARFKLFLISYLLFRFALDFFKPHYTFDIGLSTIQITCVLGLIHYYPYIVKPTRLLSTAHSKEPFLSQNSKVMATEQ